MAENESVLDEFEEDNYYAILNVSKEASFDEVKAAYRNLCKIYHPDRHTEIDKKEIGEKLFNKVQKAYEVLSNQDLRAIYDIYGQKGLDAGWEVIERRRSPAEIQEEYERLQRQKEEERLQRRTNPKGTTVIGVDSSDLFERYDNEYDDFGERNLPNIEVNKMTINQSIEAPMTSKDTVILSGNLTVQNGNGSGQVSAAWRRVISTTSWGEVEYSAGNGPMLHLKAFRNLGRRSYGTLGFAFHKRNNAIGAGVQATIARQLGKTTTGYITWKGGSGSSMESSLVKETENGSLQCGLQLGIRNCSTSFSYQYKLDTDTYLKTGIKLGLLSSNFNYGIHKKISEHSSLGGTIQISSMSGVTLKIRFNRSNQTFVFPITLSESFSPMAVFYGTLTPLLLYWSVTTLIIKPFLMKEKEKETKMNEEKYAEKLAEMKREAEQCVELMAETYQKCLECERERHGLEIVNGYYGNFFSLQENDVNNPYRQNKVIDVTIPLQCLVKDSKLILTETSKTQLSGFYDPCIGQDKSLRVRYLFRDVLHEVTINDKESLRIPKQSHRVPTTSQ